MPTEQNNRAQYMSEEQSVPVRSAEFLNDQNLNVAYAYAVQFSVPQKLQEMCFDCRTDINVIMDIIKQDRNIPDESDFDSSILMIQCAESATAYLEKEAGSGKIQSISDMRACIDQYVFGYLQEIRSKIINNMSRRKKLA